MEVLYYGRTLHSNGPPHERVKGFTRSGIHKPGKLNCQTKENEVSLNAIDIVHGDAAWARGEKVSLQFNRKIMEHLHKWEEQPRISYCYFH